MTGYLKLFIGPMFSGKTSSLIALFRRFTKAGKKVLVINFAGDLRYSSTHLSSHDGQSIPCKMIYNLDDIENEINDYEIILINEGQFFDNLKNKLLYWVEKLNKRVYVCGLDGDFQRNHFGDMNNLIPFADEIEKLCAICENCGNDAPFTFRNPNVSNGSQVQIGVKEYKACCRKCYIYENNNISKSN